MTGPLKLIICIAVIAIAAPQSIRLGAKAGVGTIKKCEFNNETINEIRTNTDKPIPENVFGELEGKSCAEAMEFIEAGFAEISEQGKEF